MFKFIKNFLTLEPPIGEIWIAIVIGGLLAIVGLVDFTESVAWVAAALVYVSIFLSIYLLQKAFVWLWNVIKSK
jgi:hypothetical protein